MEEFLKCVPVLYTEDTSDYESIQNVPCSQYNLNKVINLFHQCLSKFLLFQKIKQNNESICEICSWIFQLLQFCLKFSSLWFRIKIFWKWKKKGGTGHKENRGTKTEAEGHYSGAFRHSSERGEACNRTGLLIMIFF